MSARLAVRKCVQSDTDKKQKKRLDEESLDEEKCFMLKGMVWTLGFVTLCADILHAQLYDTVIGKAPKSIICPCLMLF